MNLSPDHCSDVKLFHDKFGLVTPEQFTIIDRELFNFRVLFFNEELTEYEDSYRDGDLATAIDSLIDLVYITAGCALLHGIKPTEFANNAVIRMIENDKYKFISLSSVITGSPRLPDTTESGKLVDAIKQSISDYEAYYEERNEAGIKKALADLYLFCLIGKTILQFTIEQWSELWTDVQRANMSKERALRAEDSKRGSTYDVIKPAGWVPPRTNEIVAKFIGA